MHGEINIFSMATTIFIIQYNKYNAVRLCDITIEQKVPLISPRNAQ